MIVDFCLDYIQPGRDMKINQVLFIVLSIVFLSCSKKEDPESVLMDYINYRFSSNQNKNFLLENTTGVLRDRIESMSDKEFQEFIDMTKYKKGKFKVLLKKCTEEKCFITYALKYIHFIKGKKAYEIEVKKIAEILKTDQKWRISNINNLKSYVDGKLGIDITDH